MKTIYDYMITHFDNSNFFKINAIYIERDTLLIEGVTAYGSLGKEYSLCVIDDNNTEYLPEVEPSNQITTAIYEEGPEVVLDRFRFEIPLYIGMSMRFVLKKNNKEFADIKPHFSGNSSLNKKRYSYYLHKRYLIVHCQNKIIVKEKSFIGVIGRELKYQKNNIWGGIDSSLQIILLRWIAVLRKLFAHREIWLISDRARYAGDNGEAFFRYMISKKTKLRIYYVIDKECEDYKRVKNIGKVIPQGSFLHKLRHLEASKLITSHSEPWIKNPFYKKKKYISNLVDYSYVYLKHGILKDEPSKMHAREKSHARLFCTVNSKERDAITNLQFGLTEREVKITGLARYDLLESDTKKKIVILPTWRRYVCEKSVDNGISWGYVESFKKTEYYKFYNSLIHNERLKACMLKNGYTAEFYMHPVLRQNENDFEGNDIIGVVKGNPNYNLIFKDCALMVTDFSSVAFDFAYLKKPIVYSQFDKEEFYEKHWKKSFYDYDRDGFGPVCLNLEETINNIIRYIEHDCRMEEMYQERVDAFFQYRDCNNCERIYNEIIKI